MQHENAFKSFKSKINEMTLSLPNQLSHKHYNKSKDFKEII